MQSGAIGTVSGPSKVKVLEQTLADRLALPPPFAGERASQQTRMAMHRANGSWVTCIAWCTLIVVASSYLIGVRTDELGVPKVERYGLDRYGAGEVPGS